MEDLKDNLRRTSPDAKWPITIRQVPPEVDEKIRFIKKAVKSKTGSMPQTWQVVDLVFKLSEAAVADFLESL